MKKLLAALCLAAPLLQPMPSAAADWPNQSLRWLVPYPAGGGSDFLARTIGQSLSTRIGQAVVVENKPGGNTGIAASEAARAAADGHTMMSADNGTLVFNPALYQKLVYDVKDLAPVTLMGRFPMILVTSPELPAKDLAEFTALVKNSANGFNYASAGAGSPHHLAMELFRTQAKLEMTHAPYRGAAPALSDVASGQVPAMMVDLAAGAGFIRSGKVRPLAVAHSQRLAQLPEVPTFAELGLQGVEAAALVGLAVPAATPKDTIAALNRAVVETIREPQVEKKLIEFGIEPVGNTPEEYAALLESETTRWHRLIRELGISLD
ncbi:tripartite tricarboxylate transporter substrate binding protein [Vandammella animalimorsus]|uniref:Tripartite tricarboxylate transporter substrate binding protein n=1 Tax=Vandammella animalimorsus TaxID=2029117 RepID=A0A3M6RQL6_9BURK|nr:tripartite tricarboxylate transporter substrate binding protein [Vandammella animalimorsus]